MPHAAHVIKLRGPWQIRLLDSGGVLQDKQRVRIRTEDDWQAWFAETRYADNVRTVAFLRTFNWPAPQTPPTGMELRFCGIRPAVALLNGTAVDVLELKRESGLPANPPEVDVWSTVEVFQADVLPLIESANRLEISFDLAKFDTIAARNGTWLQGVCLRIHEHADHSGKSDG